MTHVEARIFRLCDVARGAGARRRRLTLDVSGTTELVTWLQGFAEHAAVEDMPAFREEIVATIVKMNAAYADHATSS